VQRQSLKAEVETVTIVGNTVIDDKTVQLPGSFGLNLARASSAFVGDSAIFGFLSPIMGTRYRYEVDSLTGNLHFNTALADYRKYFFFRPVTLAVRGIHYGRYGRDSEDTRIQPLFVGDPALVHGYEFNSINLNECVPSKTNPNACPVFDRLFGSKIGIVNAEVRVPLFGTREFGLATGFLPTELFFFGDAGVAWSQHQKAKFAFKTNTSERVPSVSAGVGTRLLLSYIPLEFYYAKPFQRPGAGWVFGFNIIPGW
jgi:outer membrane protein assembly factor BamA